jgi:hypothetical protein
MPAQSFITLPFAVEGSNTRELCALHFNALAQPHLYADPVYGSAAALTAAIDASGYLDDLDDLAVRQAQSRLTKDLDNLRFAP